MDSVIRKISIGSDYKNDAMHYSVGQQVYGGHEIAYILCLYDFIVKPVGEKYNNTVRIGDKDLVVNTKIENWKFVNRIAEVIETPLAFNSNIEKGNLVVIHQNVFRTFYDMKGNKKKSRSYFKDDLFFCGADQVYLYKN